MIDYEKENAARAPSTPSATAASFLIPTNAKLLRQISTAATWLWVYAGCSVINWVLGYVHAPIGLALSLFATDFAFAVARELGSIAPLLALLFNVLLVGLVILLGLQVKKWRAWAFVTAIVLLGIDGWMIYSFTVFAIWPFLLHGLSLYYLFLGLKAAKLLRQRRAQGQA